VMYQHIGNPRTSGSGVSVRSGAACVVECRDRSLGAGVGCPSRTGEVLSRMGEVVATGQYGRFAPCTVST